LCFRVVITSGKSSHLGCRWPRGHTGHSTDCRVSPQFRNQIRELHRRLFPNGSHSGEVKSEPSVRSTATSPIRVDSQPPEVGSDPYPNVGVHRLSVRHQIEQSSRSSGSVGKDTRAVVQAMQGSQTVQFWVHLLGLLTSAQDLAARGRLQLRSLQYILFPGWI